MTPEETVALQNLASLARAYADALTDELDLLADGETELVASHIEDLARSLTRARALVGAVERREDVSLN